MYVCRCSGPRSVSSPLPGAGRSFGRSGRTWPVGAARSRGARGSRLAGCSTPWRCSTRTSHASTRRSPLGYRRRQLCSPRFGMLPSPPGRRPGRGRISSLATMHRRCGPSWSRRSMAISLSSRSWQSRRVLAATAASGSRPRAAGVSADRNQRTLESAAKGRVHAVDGHAPNSRRPLYGFGTVFEYQKKSPSLSRFPICTVPGTPKVRDHDPHAPEGIGWGCRTRGRETTTKEFHMHWQRISFTRTVLLFNNTLPTKRERSQVSQRGPRREMITGRL